MGCPLFQEGRDPVGMSRSVHDYVLYHVTMTRHLRVTAPKLIFETHVRFCLNYSWRSEEHIDLTMLRDEFAQRWEQEGVTFDDPADEVMQVERKPWVDLLQGS